MPNAAFAVVAQTGETISEHEKKSAAESAKARHADKRPTIVPINGRDRQPAASVPAGGEVRQIPLTLIAPSPFNPRKTFEPTALKQLAKSMADPTIGQLQETVARVSPKDAGRYELIGGERRYRAAKLAKLETLRCRVIEADDKLAVELCGIENYEREDLNPVEEAAWFKSMIDTGGYTQRTLAARLGLSQPKVSQRLALLALPAAWRKRVITGVIPATWARELVPWIERKTVIDHASKMFKSWNPVDVEDFRGMIRQAIQECSRPLSGWAGHEHGEVAFRPTKKQLEELDTVDHTFMMFGSKRTDTRCFNLARWQELQDAGRERRKEREATQQVKAAAKSHNIEPGPDREATAAKVNAAAKREATAAKVNAAAKREALNRKIYQYKIEWLQAAIAAKISSERNPATNTRLLVFFAVAIERRLRPPQCLDAHVAEHGGKPVRDFRSWVKTDAWATLERIPDDKLDAVVADLLREWVQHDTTYNGTDIFAKDVERIADVLLICLEKDWRLDRKFLELHTTAQLLDLVKQNQGWRFDPAELKGKKRSDLIDTILAADVPVPKSLATIKPPKDRS